MRTLLEVTVWAMYDGTWWEGQGWIQPSPYQPMAAPFTVISQRVAEGPKPDSRLDASSLQVFVETVGVTATDKDPIRPYLTILPTREMKPFRWLALDSLAQVQERTVPVDA